MLPRFRGPSGEICQDVAERLAIEEVWVLVDETERAIHMTFEPLTGVIRVLLQQRLQIGLRERWGFRRHACLGEFQRLLR